MNVLLVDICIRGLRYKSQRFLLVAVSVIFMFLLHIEIHKIVPIHNNK